MHLLLQNKLADDINSQQLTRIYDKIPEFASATKSATRIWDLLSYDKKNERSCACASSPNPSGRASQRVGPNVCGSSRIVFACLGSFLSITALGCFHIRLPYSSWFWILCSWTLCPKLCPNRRGSGAVGNQCSTRKSYRLCSVSRSLRNIHTPFTIGMYTEALMLLVRDYRSVATIVSSSHSKTH